MRGPYICEVCGKPYKSRSGLRDHRKSHRDAAAGTQMPMPIAGTKAGAAALTERQILGEACEALGIDHKDVLSFKVYPPDTVVIIEGPVGFKRKWTRGDKR